MPTFGRSLALLLMATLGTHVLAADQEPLKRPIGIVPLSDGKSAVVANRSGSIALVDLAAAKVVVETSLGQRFSSVAALGDRTFALTDEHRHCLLVVDQPHETAAFAVRQEVAVAPYPVDVLAVNRHLLSVSSLWSRQVTLLERREATEPFVPQHVIDLPFAPRSQCVLPGTDLLLVCDAFGGQLALLNHVTGKVEQHRVVNGQGLRGVAVAAEGDSLVIAQQMLNPHAHANRNDIHWGLLMSNDVRWVQLDSLLDAERNVYAGSRVVPLGLPGRGRGDPAGVAVHPSGLTAVCAAGTNELLMGRRDDDAWRVVKVGAYPTAVAFLPAGDQLVVANTFGDSLSVVDAATRRVTATIPLSGDRPRTPLERGEELFHDARLSHEGWLSCHSCHAFGHSNFALNDNLSDGGFGAPKLVLSLLGRRQTAPFAWNAAVPDLATQVQNSLDKTMQSDHPPLSPQDNAALVAYLESLPAPPSVDRLRGHLDTAAVARGEALFRKQSCHTCHAPPSFTTPGVEDVELTDEVQQSRFNPPSLLGVSQRDAFLHDGRARTLQEVFLEHRHPSEAKWSEQEVNDLVAFLRSL